jgi:hypothetical protein
MGHTPPGLESTPDDRSLAGFGSLMPSAEKKPGIISRIVKLPFKIAALPFRLVKAILGFPARLFARRKT